MADQLNQPQLPPKPSFFSSVMSGIGGFVKGALAGGLVGIIGGALVGTIVAGITLATGGAAGIPIAAVLLGSMGTGATIGGSALASLGSIAGAVTGVVKSREAGQPSAQDIVNVAKISFEQGRVVQHQLEQQQSQGKPCTKHQDKYLKDKAAMAMAEHHVVN